MFNARVAGLSIGAALAIATPFIAKHEGLRQHAYLDPVRVPTICYGSTLGVNIGDYKSKKECDDLLGKEIYGFMTAVDKAVTVDLPPARRAALTSFAYNVGVANFKRSTLLKKLNAGDTVGACNELDRWVYAKGKKLNGLVKRRKEEKKLCLQEYQNPTC